VFASPRKTHYRDRANFGVWVDYGSDGEAADIYYYMHGEPVRENGAGTRVLDDDAGKPVKKRSGKSQRIRVEQYPLASVRINALMGPLLELVKSRPLLWNRLFEVRFLAGFNTDEVIVTLLYHRKLGMVLGFSARTTWVACVAYVPSQARSSCNVGHRDFQCHAGSSFPAKQLMS
jgi:hypothetical protein